MAVRLLFLGRLQDLAGGGERVARSGASVDAVLASLEPALADELRSERVRIAVNGIVAARDAPIADGDEIAFLPPVSGG